MIILEAEQGSLEWHQARLGIPTASRFSDIITPAGAKSKSAEGYMKELAGEWLMGKPDPDNDFESYWMKRGKELEPQARALYSLMRDIEVTECGFVYKDALRQIGCSPDGLIGEDGGWENKTPKMTTHVGYLLSGIMPAIYRPQVQGSMWITGREWWDFQSFHPETEPMIFRVLRDVNFITKLETIMKEFLIDLTMMKHKLERYKL